MYDMNDKERLYWLIDQYLLEKINETIFCNEFHNLFVNEMDIKMLTNLEYEAFSNLNNVSQRFSEYEEDFKLWTGFVTAEELKQKIIETREKLQGKRS